MLIGMFKLLLEKGNVPSESLNSTDVCRLLDEQPAKTKKFLDVLVANGVDVVALTKGTFPEGYFGEYIKSIKKSLGKTATADVTVKAVSKGAKGRSKGRGRAKGKQKEVEEQD